jgi:hypothetical protein
MKTLKVYDDVHTAVKVAAAQEGRTTTNIASLILRKYFGLSDCEPEPDEEKEETEEGAAK